jgi:predicted CxxxxCH...CXXCH cytochrome family protein
VSGDGERDRGRTLVRRERPRFYSVHDRAIINLLLTNEIMVNASIGAGPCSCTAATSCAGSVRKTESSGAQRHSRRLSIRFYGALSRRAGGRRHSIAMSATKRGAGNRAVSGCVGGARPRCRDINCHSTGRRHPSGRPTRGFAWSNADDAPTRSARDLAALRHRSTRALSWHSSRRWSRHFLLSRECRGALAKLIAMHPQATDFAAESFLTIP